jgi:Fe-S cluster assembly scaffold protein SufB
MIVKGKNEKPLVIEKSTQVVCAPSSRAILFDTTAKTTTIDVKPHAEIFYISWNKKMKKAIVGKEATIHWIELCTTDVKTETILAGKKAHARFLTLSIGKNMHISVHNTVLHQAKETISDIIMFSTLKQSTSFLRGTTIIEKHASGIAHQNFQTILLDENSHASALPEMFISTADVQASHHASAGQIKPETVFYMMSRGIDETTAQRIVTQSHITALLHQYPLEVQHILYDLLQKKCGENYEH